MFGQLGRGPAMCSSPVKAALQNISGGTKKKIQKEKKERKKKRFDISLNQGRGAALRSGWTVFLSEMEGLLRGFVPEKNDHFRQ